MIGKWDAWYTNVTKPENYGHTESYKRAAAFLDGLSVEDWGCGKGGFRKYHKGPYIGIDGSHNPFVDKIADLRQYRSRSEGILLRHVLEHNYDWQTILANAVALAQRKLCLILFTPFQDETREIAHNRQHGVDVPDIGFKQEDIEQLLDGTWQMETLGSEHIYYVEK